MGPLVAVAAHLPAASSVPGYAPEEVTWWWMTVGLGLPESFVQIQSESRMPPYLVTVGDASARGAVAFYFMGSHHTQIARTQLISATSAILPLNVCVPVLPVARLLFASCSFQASRRKHRVQ